MIVSTRASGQNTFIWYVRPNRPSQCRNIRIFGLRDLVDNGVLSDKLGPSWPLSRSLSSSPHFPIACLTCLAQGALPIFSFTFSHLHTLRRRPVNPLGAGLPKAFKFSVHLNQSTFKCVSNHRLSFYFLSLFLLL